MSATEADTTKVQNNDELADLDEGDEVEVNYESTYSNERKTFEDELADYYVAPNERIAREVRDSFVAEIHETNVIERVAEDVDEVDEVEDDRIRAGGRA